MNFKYILALFCTALLTFSCANKSENLILVNSFLEARNNFDAEKLAKLTDENYQELFRNDMVEIKNQKEFLSHLAWAKEMDSKTTMKEVVSENDAAVIVIEESTNYIYVALELKPRKYKTTYYFKDGKISKQSFDYAPDEKVDNKANDVLYGNFERYCKVKNIPLSWEPTQKDGQILRKALEAYVNREREK